MSRTKYAWLVAPVWILVALQCFAAGPPLDSGTAKSVSQIMMTVTVGGSTAKMMITAIGSGVVLLQAQEIFDNDPPRAHQPDEGIPPEPTSIPQAPNTNVIASEPPIAPAVPTSDISGFQRGETESTQSEETVPTPPKERPIIQTEETVPLLPADRPDWVARSVEASGSIHYVSVDCDPESTIEESYASLDKSILREARKYVDDYILKEKGAAEQLSQLDVNWIKSHWLVAGKQFDARYTTSGYHQGWVELKVDERDRRLVENWWQDIIRAERVKKMSGGLGVILAGVGMMHLLFGLVQRRGKKAV